PAFVWLVDNRVRVIVVSCRARHNVVTHCHAPPHACLLRETDSNVQGMFCTGTFHGLVEFSSGFAPRPGISHVLFDFDGALSLIREGWVDVMMAMFLEMLPPLRGEAEPATRQMLLDDIMRQNR